MSALTLALKRLNNSQLSAEYATRLYRHIEEWGPQLRPPVYGLLARFASDGGSLDQACGYLLKVPPLERKRVPLCEVAKRCVEMKRPDLVVSLLNGSPSLSPELVAHTIASFARSGLHAQALAYKSTLYHEMSVQARTLSWAFPFLLLSAAQSGRPGIARALIHEMTDDWGIEPSELDFNLAVFAHLRACIALNPSSSGRDKGGSGSGFGSGGYEETAGLSELFGLLFRMKALGYGLHPTVRDLDLLDPSIPQGKGDLLGGVKMSMSLLQSVPQPSAVSHPVVAVDSVEALPASTPAPTLGQGRLLAPSSFLTMAGEKLNLSPFPSLDSTSPTSSTVSMLRGRAPITESTSRDFFSLDSTKEELVAITSSSTSDGDSEVESIATGGDIDIYSAAEPLSLSAIRRLPGEEDLPLKAYSDIMKSIGESPLDGVDYEESMRALAISQAARKDLVMQSVTSTEDDRGGKSRVWTPTNMKNVPGSEAPQQDSALKKGKRSVSWPLKPSYVPLAADHISDENEGLPGDGDGDIEMDRVEDEGDMGGEGEGEIAPGDYFQDNDWLDRMTRFVNFSDEEIMSMNLMEVLVPLSAPIDSHSHAEAEAAAGASVSVSDSGSDSLELDPRSLLVLGRNTGNLAFILHYGVISLPNSLCHLTICHCTCSSHLHLHYHLHYSRTLFLTKPHDFMKQCMHTLPTLSSYFHSLPSTFLFCPLIFLFLSFTPPTLLSMFAINLFYFYFYNIR